jgi:diacylglycerol kinase (ATP)
MPEAIPIIANPAARSAAARLQFARLERLEPSPEIHVTRRPGDATELAASLVEQGHPLVVAAGGDGTVNEVLQGLCRANAGRPEGAAGASLGVLPLGTMNVFSHELGQPGRDLDGCWRQIVKGPRRVMDLWMANDLYFVQLAGVGVDAEIIRRTTWEQKRRLGPLSYVLSALKVAARRAPVLEAVAPGRAPSHGTLVLLGNGKHYGGPFPLFDRADPADGLLDVMVFHQVGPWELAQLIRRVITNGELPGEDLECFQAAELKVSVARGKQAPCELDGELQGETPVHFRHAGRMLEVAG